MGRSKVGRKRAGVIAVLGAWLVLLTSGFAAEEPQKRRKEPPQDSPRYESPILSLLFLPANLLIQMASIFAPKEERERAQTRSNHPQDR